MHGQKNIKQILTCLVLLFSSYMPKQSHFPKETLFL